MRKLLALKILLITALTFCLAGNSYSQTFVGVRAGGGASQLLNNLLNSFSKPDFYSTTFTYGAIGGVMFRHVAEPHLGFQAEINYLQRGFKQQLPEAIQNGEYIEAEYDYIQVPIMASIYALQGKTKVFFNVGPYLAFGISGTETVFQVENFEKKSSKTTDIDFGSEDFDAFDYGLEAGLGLERRFEFGILQVEGRFTWGMGNIYNADKPYYPDHTQNMTLGLTVNYLFQLDKGREKFDYVKKK
ncbi:hypothetical protein FUAX_00580 [Fulvitalea axinellae]|uniref:Outer membrane protein beta-barrel domain-containing protein n=1 Tax=Fulvitalea axinellae TaxID=1182444 RepID=A0AAU9C6I0_9BACT|nr:hypothetical protein FUAX_00580 [Fulvitalea axinellae]